MTRWILIGWLTLWMSVGLWLASAFALFADEMSVFAEPQALACGGRLDHSTLGVAHRTLPCGTRVEFRRGSRRVVARVCDRGPFKRGRTWDAMPATAAALGFRDGVHNVTAKVLP